MHGLVDGFESSLDLRASVDHHHHHHHHHHRRRRRRRRLPNRIRLLFRTILVFCH